MLLVKRSERKFPMKVYNRHRDPGVDAVYVGRGTPWGNPYELSATCNRYDSMTKYRKYVRERPGLQKLIREELSGKDLLCSCSPAPCHAEVLVEVCNDEFV